MNEWVEQQTAFLQALTSCTVLRWQGLEMALRDAGGLPEWQDGSMPFLQLVRLDVVLGDGGRSSVITYQNDDRWGLCRKDGLPPSRLRTDEPDSIYRWRWLDTLPTGRIGGLSVRLNEGDIAEVKLDVEGRELRLLAGEVYERNDGSLRIVLMDESVLVQVDGRRP
ncbi:MAG: hypothetical protein U0793_08745 [Gemmataceae bacterium]